MLLLELVGLNQFFGVSNSNNLEERCIISNSNFTSRIKLFFDWENQRHTWSNNSSFHSNNNSKPIKMIPAIVPAITAIKLGSSSPVNAPGHPENKLKVT